MTTTATNLIFRPSKTRRLVSAWMVKEHAEGAIQTVSEYHDIFDQVIFMCGGVAGDGSLPRDWSTDQRRELAKKLHGMGVSTLNDYGGSWKNCGDRLLKDMTIADRWIDRMVEECDAVGTDGVDIDFEHWPGEGRYVFNEFIRRLSVALHARNKMLSICLYALSPEARRETGIGFWDAATLAQHADHLRPMAYDMYCPPSPYIGPTSTAPWARDCMTHMVTHVPRHKLIMGLPTYSVDWDMTDPSQSRQVYDAPWIAEREKESIIGRGWCYYWDVNLIRYTDKNGHPHVMWVSDAKSTKSHLVTVDSMDLGGVCFWCLINEDKEIWKCVREHFKRW
ncbi:MAG: hypothetical protein IT444_06295 [Phycisphaeraceae bacterium]|nr:hypothetical protein [Phycisphaeraceae bacterium]